MERFMGKYSGVMNKLGVVNKYEVASSALTLLNSFVILPPRNDVIFAFYPMN